MRLAHRPPHLSQRALLFLVRGDGAEFLVGDLHEEFHQRALSDGSESAGHWYRWSVAKAVFAWWHPKSLLARRSVHRRRAGVSGSRFIRSVWGPRMVGWGIAVAGLGFVAGLLRHPDRPDAAVATDPSHLVFVHAIDRTGERYQRFTFPEVDALRSNANALVHLAGYSVARRLAMRDAERFDIRVARASEGFFEAVAAPVHLGRGITERELRDGSKVAALSFAFWTGSLRGDSSVIGSVLTISGTPITIVGVLSGVFGIPADADLWLPASPWVRQDGDREVSVLALVAAGATVDLASAQVAALVGRMRSARYGPAGVRSAWVEPALGLSGSDPRGPESPALGVGRRRAL